MGRVVLSAYWADFSTRRHWSAGTRELYADSWRRISPPLGAHTLSAITQAEVEKALVVIAGRYSPGTVRTTWGHLRAVLMAAHAEGRIPRVPRPPLPKVRGTVSVPCEDEVEALYEAAHPRMRVAIELGARVGLRRSEALGLTLDRIDRKGGAITVDRQAEPRLAATEPFRWAPRLKTDNSYPVVPVHADTLDRLPLEVEDTRGLLFTVKDTPWTGPVFGACWAKLAKRVGLPNTFHDLRHFFCTTALADGVNPKAVAKAAGMDAATLWATYSHLLPDDDDRLRLALRREKAPAMVLAPAIADFSRSELVRQP
jgi:integrase